MLQNIQSIINFFLIVSTIIHFDAFAKEKKKAQRIIGGWPCKSEEFPTLVSIEKRGNHICGGSIISELHILTAAHCCEQLTALDNPGLKILAGDIRIDGEIDELRQTIDVKRVKMHPEYDTEKIINDIAILTLENKLVLNKQIAIVILSVEPVRPHSKLIIAGWGDTNPIGGTGSAVCLATGIQVHEKDKCIYPESFIQSQTLLESQICAGDLTGKNDSCQGDSGGPLYCGNKQCGVVSYGFGCAAEGYGALYTDVSYYQSWIADETRKSSVLTADNEIAIPRRQSISTGNSRLCNKVISKLILVYSAFRHGI